MKSPKTTMAALVFGFAMLSTTPSQAAKYNMGVFDGDWDTVAETWRYQTTNEDPGNGSGCAASPDKWDTQSGTDLGDGYREIFTLGEPFHGSVSRTRYVTLCKKGAYLNFVTYELTISHSSCGMWLCETSHIATVIRSSRGVAWQDRHIADSGGFSSRFEVLLNLK